MSDRPRASDDPWHLTVRATGSPVGQLVLILEVGNVGARKIMRRRIPVVGETLSSGGRILGYAQSVGFRFRGHMAALIGGEAYCDVCKSIGTIAKTGGPRRMHYMTARDVALDGDAVLCKCGTPPRIVATLSLESWYEDTAGHYPDATNGGSELQSARFCYDEQFTLSDSSSKPLANVRYRIRSDCGQVITGTTNANGETQRFVTTAPASLQLEVMETL